ncbi:hypothetical protein ACHAWT_009888 [Skeletonema menzelii]
MRLLDRKHHSEGEASGLRVSELGNQMMNRRKRGDRHIGLGDGARRSQLGPDHLEGSKKERYEKYQGNIPLEDEEKYVRSKVENRPMILVLIGYYTALKIFVLYLISWSSVVACALSVGLTIHWYKTILERSADGTFVSIGMDWVILGFAVVTPLSLSVNISFRRRERALIEISKFRSFAFQLLLSHAVWDWDKGGKASVPGIDWVAHTDEVLTELIAVGDELCRFLTLPSTSRSRHRMTKSGRREAARTAEVAYMLYESLYTQRMTRLALLSEKVKLAGLGASEASRIRQYERWIGDAIENLRMIKSYRTPQTLRSFTRIFSTLLPPFFAPTFAQLGFTTGSLGYGITFAVITSLCLNALVEGIDILEDPFVGFVTLDGIDVREEFQVLHYQQLVSARNNLYKDEKKYGEGDNFVISPDMLDDIESPMVPSSQRDALTPDTNNTGLQLDSSDEKSSPKTPRRHRTFVSFGDANLLDGIDDITSRESGYQIYGRKTRAHPFFKNPPRRTSSELKEEDNEDSTQSQRSPDIRVTEPHQNKIDPLLQPHLNEDIEENVPIPMPMDIQVEGKDDEESSQNIQSNADTLPRRNENKTSPPPLASLFQPPAQQKDEDERKNE